MENVEHLVKVARALKKDERVGTIGTAAKTGVKIGAGAGAGLGALMMAKQLGPAGLIAGGRAALL